MTSWHLHAALVADLLGALDDDLLALKLFDRHNLEYPAELHLLELRARAGLSEVTREGETRHVAADQVDFVIIHLAVMPPLVVIRHLFVILHLTVTLHLVVIAGAICLVVIP